MKWEAISVTKMRSRRKNSSQSEGHLVASKCQPICWTTRPQTHTHPLLPPPVLPTWRKISKISMFFIELPRSWGPTSCRLLVTFNGVLYVIYNSVVGILSVWHHSTQMPDDNLFTSARFVLSLSFFSQCDSGVVSTGLHGLGSILAAGKKIWSLYNTPPSQGDGKQRIVSLRSN